MSYGITDEHDRPRITPAVQALIAANVFVYFIQLTVVSPADMWGALAFQMKDLQRAWWTIGTYMFVHAGFWHLAVNMYTLYIFGPRVEHHGDARSFTLYYFWCGLGGWLAHLLFVREGYLLGASAAVLGVSLAYAMRWPDDEVLFFGFVPMKVKWLVAFFTLFNLVNGVWDATAGTGSGTAYFAHLGGLAFGFFWLRTPPSQSVDRLRRRVAAVPDVSDEPPRAIPRSLPRPRERGHETDEVVAKSKAIVAKRPAVSDPMTTLRDQKVDALNRVLDKISRTGLSSLTSEERRLLEELSRQLKKNRD